MSAIDAVRRYYRPLCLTSFITLGKTEGYKGATGAKGAKGATGATRAKGAKGVMGAKVVKAAGKETEDTDGGRRKS